MSLDDNDVNILTALQANGRLSYRQISERVGVSVPTVSSKVNTMENQGVIRGYRASLDPERLGEMSTVVAIKARPADLSRVSEYFINDAVVRQLFFLSCGRLLLMCTFTRVHEINEFASRLSTIPELLEYDVANVIAVGKEEDRAVVAPGLQVVMPCSQCGRQMREEPLKLRKNGKEFYLCSPTCLSAFNSKDSSARSVT